MLRKRCSRQRNSLCKATEERGDMVGELPRSSVLLAYESECGGFPMKLKKLKLQGPSLDGHFPRNVSIFL